MPIRRSVFPAILIVALAFLTPFTSSAMPHGSSTTEVILQGNLDASANIQLPPQNIASFADLQNSAQYNTTVTIYDSLGQAHVVSIFFFHSGWNAYLGQAYVNNEEVDALPIVSQGLPRIVSLGSPYYTDMVFVFGGDGNQSTPSYDYSAGISWNNGADPQQFRIFAPNIIQAVAPSNIISIQNGLSPSATTVDRSYVPAAPVLRVTKRSINVVMESQVGVRYEVVAIKSQKSIQLITSDISPILQGLSPGKWHVKYRLIGRNGATTFRSRFSATTDAVVS